MIALLFAATSPFAGNYEGIYRAGFLDYRPIAVQITATGSVTMSNGRLGKVEADGSCVMRENGPFPWYGAMWWEGSTLRGGWRFGSAMFASMFVERV